MYVYKHVSVSGQESISSLWNDSNFPLETQIPGRIFTMLYSTLSLFLLPSIAVLVTGVPHTPRAGFDPDDPTASDPKTPPSSLDLPHLPLPENPFAGGFAEVPAPCTDFHRPSEGWLTDLYNDTSDGVGAFGGGKLSFDGKS